MRRFAAGILTVACAALLLPGVADAKRLKAPTPWIVNAEATASVAYQVGLVELQDGGVAVPFEVFCGGTVRDATHIITAAHCVPDRSAADIAVVAGINARSQDPATSKIRAVSAITSHPSFRGVATGNDLAILTLSSPLTLSSVAKTLPTPAGAIGTVGVIPPNVAATGVAAWLSGWGLPAEKGSSPDPLLVARVLVLPNSSCANYGTSFDPATMLCAGRSVGAATIDTCQGDSGGPLVYNPPNTFEYDVLIGIVSFGRGCANPQFPGIYTKLANPDLNARALAANPPVRTEPGTVTISGTPQVGQTLTCDPGTWTGGPTFTYEWLSAAVGADGKPTGIRGEGTAQTLPVGPALATRIVTCEATGVNAGGARTVQAKAVGPVTSAPPAPAAPVPPPAAAAIPTDLVAPTAAFTRVTCRKRRCSLTVTASDSGGPATRAVLSYERRTGCPKGKKGRACRAVKTITMGGSRGVFSVTTPKLAKATYRFSVVATDAAGNRSRAAVTSAKIR